MMLTRAELCQFIERGPAVKDNIEILGDSFYFIYVKKDHVEIFGYLSYFINPGKSNLILFRTSAFPSHRTYFQFCDFFVLICFFSDIYSFLFFYSLISFTCILFFLLF